MTGKHCKKGQLGNTAKKDIGKHCKKRMAGKQGNIAKKDNWETLQKRTLENTAKRTVRKNCKKIQLGNTAKQGQLGNPI
jgi:hypothetical protein